MFLEKNALLLKKVSAILTKNEKFITYPLYVFSELNKLYIAGSYEKLCFL